MRALESPKVHENIIFLITDSLSLIGQGFLDRKQALWHVNPTSLTRPRRSIFRNFWSRKICSTYWIDLKVVLNKPIVLNFSFVSLGTDGQWVIEKTATCGVKLQNYCSLFRIHSPTCFNYLNSEAFEIILEIFFSEIFFLVKTFKQAWFSTCNSVLLY